MNKLTSIITQYLRERPAFYAFLRPQEAYFLYQRIKKMRGLILDFGCGDGFFASTIFKKKYIDVGLDLSSSRINRAPQTQIYKKIKTYDGITIPFENGTFGTIISNCVFEHVPHIEKSVKEMYRITKKNGLLMTTVMCSSWSGNLLGGKLFGSIYINWFNKIQHHVSLFSKQEWANLFTTSGYEIVESIDYLYEKAAQKTEVYHYLSFFSLLTYLLFKRWRISTFVSQTKVKAIENLLQKDNKNPSACFFVLRRV